ncbi:MAG: hypothetical protein ABW069_02420, partial [Duganella sp.]
AGAEAGGAATANARVRSSYSALANATAYGGSAFYNAGAGSTASAAATSSYRASANAAALSGSGRFGLMSPASAEAIASVERQRGAPQPPDTLLASDARARAFASAQGSTVRASSSYRDVSLGATVTAVAASSAQAGEFQPEALSAANVGGDAYGMSIFSGDNPAQVVSYASALPVLGSIGALVVGSPTVSWAFAGGDVLGAGTVGAMFFPFTSTAAFQVPFASGRHLLLGLLNPYPSWNASAAFTFSVSNDGVSLYSGSFAAQDPLEPIFSDKVIDLGVINRDRLDLLVTFSLTEGLYGFNYILGSPSAVPELSTWLMLALGLALLTWRAGRTRAGFSHPMPDLQHRC